MLPFVCMLLAMWLSLLIPVPTDTMSRRIESNVAMTVMCGVSFVFGRWAERSAGGAASPKIEIDPPVQS